MKRLLGIGRKLEKARDQQMNSNNDLNRKLDVESKHLLGVFPQLVWENIFKYLNCEDLQNLINSSPFFRNFFLEKRDRILFRNVLKVFVPWLRGNFHYNMGSVYFDTSENEVESLVFNCRLVCRAWNKCICDLAQEIFLIDRAPYYEIQNLRCVFGFINKSFEFNCPENIESFIKTFENSASNPFCGESISLVVPPSTSHFQDIIDDRIFHDKTLHVLELFGKFVSNCEIRLTRQFTTSTYNGDPDQSRGYVLEPTYLKLLNILWNMPNLKVLKVRQSGNLIEKDLDFTSLPPTLKNLQTLELYNVPITMCDAIIRSNLHINKLFIRYGSHAKYKSGYLLHPYENLTDLDLMWYNRYDIGHLENNNVNWKLKSLTLNCFYTKECHSTLWSEVFNILSKICTLEDLKLGLPEIFKEDTSKLARDMLKYRLNFPNLKKVHFIVKNYAPFDFLLGISESLEILHISLLQVMEGGKKKNLRIVKNSETVKFYSCFCRYCRSKLWMAFPKLKSVYLSYLPLSVEFSFKRNEYKLWENKSTLFKYFSKRLHPTKNFAPKGFFD